jgi:hypothetical protein
MSRADGAVELDLLADYAAGVLDPAQAAEVEERLRTEPRWAAAMDALLVADAAVRADLRDLAPPAMPDDVADRIDRALRSADHDRPGDRRLTPVESAHRSAADRRPPGRSTSTGPRSAARRRRLRLVTGIGAAAAAVGLALAGLAGLGGGLNSPTSAIPGLGQADTANDGGRGAAEGPQPTSGEGSPVQGESGLTVFTSSGNYTAQTLSQLALKAPGSERPPMAPAPAVTDDTTLWWVPDAVRQAVPPPLARLTDPAALTACLNAIGLTHPGRAVLVDYATYEGRPALLVVVRFGDSATVVAVGPDCGLVGPDELATARAP